LWGDRAYDGHKGGTADKLVVDIEPYEDVVRRIITNPENECSEALVEL
jgi:hypothetical protein